MSWALIRYSILPPSLVSHTVSVDVKNHEIKVSQLTQTTHTREVTVAHGQSVSQKIQVQC